MARHCRNCRVEQAGGGSASRRDGNAFSQSCSAAAQSCRSAADQWRQHNKPPDVLQTRQAVETAQVDVIGQPHYRGCAEDAQCCVPVPWYHQFPSFGSLSHSTPYRQWPVVEQTKNPMLKQSTPLAENRYNIHRLSRPVTSHKSCKR